MPKRAHVVHTKWTAVEPRNKEKHFLVTKVIEPEPPGSPVVSVEVEAVHSKRADHRVAGAHRRRTVAAGVGVAK